MCPAVRRDCAIRNTRLLRTYAENDTQFRKGVNFLKRLIGHASSFSAKTQGISSYGWAIPFTQYCIASRRIFVDPEDFEVHILENQHFTASGLLTKFLAFVLLDPLYQDVDIAEIRPRVIRKYPRAPRILDPYERSRFLDQYLTEGSWAELLSCVRRTQKALLNSPQQAVLTAKQKRRLAKEKMKRRHG